MADYTLNKTGAELDALGTIVLARNSLNVLTTGTYTDLCSITLTKGVWVITGQMRINVPAVGASILSSISTTSATVDISFGGFAQIQNATIGYIATNTSRVLQVSSSSQTVYLVGYQNSGSDAAILANQCNLYAVRVG